MRGTPPSVPGGTVEAGGKLSLTAYAVLTKQGPHKHSHLPLTSTAAVGAPHLWKNKALGTWVRKGTEQLPLLTVKQLQ